MDFIHQISNNDPVSVWLLHSFENETGNYDQFVRPNDELYRTEALYNEMRKLASDCSTEHDEQLLTNCFTIPFIAAQFSRKKNTWKPTRTEFLPDIQSSCLEYSHGGLWNTKYDRESIILVDMAACYPGRMR